MLTIKDTFDGKKAQFFHAGKVLPTVLAQRIPEVMRGEEMHVLWIKESCEEILEIEVSENEKLMTIVDAHVAANLIEHMTDGIFHHTLLVGEHAIFNTASRSSGGKLTHRVELSEAAHATTTIALFGTVQHNLEATVRGRNAVSDVNVLLRATGKQRTTSHVQNAFLERVGGGQIFVRALAEDHAHLDVAGKIMIGLQGGGTDTYLTQEVLLLDTTATVNAIPGLEIKTNDVRASHSASVSRLTPEDLFYLASRGLSQEEARKLFLVGFLGAVAERAGTEPLARVVLDWILTSTGEVNSEK